MADGKKRIEKIAIVHDSMMEFGGAERLLSQIVRIFPKADIYTAVAEPKVVRRITKKQIKTTFLNHIGLIKKKPSLIQLLSPLAWLCLDLKKYDLVITHSSFNLANIVNFSGKRIDYVLTPPRNIFKIDPPWGLQKIIPYDRLLRHIYKTRISTSRNILVISKTVQKRLVDCLGINSKIIYPGVEIPPLKEVQKAKKNRSNYFLTVSRLDKNKMLDSVIETFNKLNLPLFVVGTGKEEGRLKKIAGKNTVFLGFVSDEKLEQLYLSAKGFIFSALNEDYGLAPVEAMAHGCPVVGYFGGGLRETLVNGKTGVFFHQPTEKSLSQAINKFAHIKFDSLIIREHAKKFSNQKFRKEFSEYVNRITTKNVKS